MLSLALALAAQQGPQSQPSETVAKPKKKDIPRPADTTTDEDQPKIPTQYKKDKEVPTSLPTFHSDVTAVQVEVSVLDNKGHFIQTSQGQVSHSGRQRSAAARSARTRKRP